MLKELSAASSLLARLLRLPAAAIPAFTHHLPSLLALQYHSYWNPQRPSLHSAHRALSSFPNRLDTLLVRALELSNVDIATIQARLATTEMIVWIDPGEVSYRIGERGVVVTVFKEGSSAASTSAETHLFRGAWTPPSSRTASPTTEAATPPSPPQTKLPFRPIELTISG